MNTSAPTVPCDEDRQLLRESTGGWLQRHWSVEHALARAEGTVSGTLAFVEGAINATHLLVAVDAPGLALRPSMAMYGHTYCTEFLDNVRVPADALVGPLNGGWKVLTTALATERIIMGSNVTHLLVRFEQLLVIVRERIGQLAAEIEVARQLLTASIQIMEQGKLPIHEAAMSKVYTSELMERPPEAALDILGTSATLAEAAPGAISDGGMEQLLRHYVRGRRRHRANPAQPDRPARPRAAALIWPIQF